MWLSATEISKNSRLFAAIKAYEYRGYSTYDHINNMILGILMQFTNHQFKLVMWLRSQQAANGIYVNYVFCVICDKLLTT